MTDILKDLEAAVAFSDWIIGRRSDEIDAFALARHLRTITNLSFLRATTLVPDEEYAVLCRGHSKDYKDGSVFDFHFDRIIASYKAALDANRDEGLPDDFDDYITDLLDRVDDKKADLGDGHRISASATYYIMRVELLGERK